jgi:hypothetical protein
MISTERINSVLTRTQVQDILSHIDFPGYTFTLIAVGSDGGFAIRIEYDEPDVMTGVEERQYGRPWLLDGEWSETQIVQTCLKAVLTSLEHRARENFTYYNKAVFQPHFNMSALLDASPLRTVAMPEINFNGTGQS